uniref:CWF19-like protein 2 n=1 Tax=Oryzias sinensis TaxID=183150 RepID=A0A8C7ZG61_9TELE
MAAYGVSFESSSNIEEAKEKKRQARQEAIQKAKQQYEKEERRKELKRQRGEDTWILPEVNQRLEQLGDDGSVKSKKKKKEKKSKKKKEKKKDKKEKRKTEAGDASSVDSEVDRLPIDEWMTFDFLAMKTVSTSERRAEKERQKEVERAKTRAVEQASLEKLELNPFWKDGGSGLPPEEIAAPVVNDGGLSWLKNSYRRMKEQAEREQRSLDSVVSERYGVRTNGRLVQKPSRLTMLTLFCLFLYVLWFIYTSCLLILKSAGSCALLENSCPYLVRTEEESEEEDEENDETPLLSEEEMNRLGSKLIKAEMMGNTVSLTFYATVGSSEDQEVLLYRTDSSGRAWPVKGPSGPVEPHGGRRKKKAIETHVGGERVRYFQDDDRLDLQEMVRREKMSSAMDQNALYSRMASKMMGKTDGDNYTLDDMFVSSAAQREGEGREEERMKNKAVGESRRLAASMEKCQFCFSSQELQKHLIVAIGCKVYLSLPAGVSLTEGHCLICPLQHHSCGTALDEDVWSEMQMFRRTLVRMFEDQDLDCVFMETHMNPRRKLHMVLECIPLPRELGDMAPIYFKKAIMECDEEWAMNKKIVDLSSRDIRQAVPRGLPYFAVDFGLQGGFAHVIENEQKFPHYFGKEIVGGMMDVEPRRWRKSIRENFDDQRKKVLQFAAWWKPFDCTKTEG